MALTKAQYLQGLIDPMAVRFIIDIENIVGHEVRERNKLATEIRELMVERLVIRENEK